MSAETTSVRWHRTWALPRLGRVARRLSSALLVLVVVSVAMFAFIHLAPGGPEQAMAGQFATPGQLAAIRHEYRLDDPLTVQYLHYASSVLRLDFGTSLMTHEPVMQSILRAAAVTVPLMLLAWALSIVLGIGLGIVSATRRDSLIDRLIVVLTSVGASMPLFATAVILTWIFGVQLAWLPTVGGGSGGMDSLVHLILPAATIVTLALASATRVTRVSVQHILAEDHFTFARARGLGPRYLLFGEILKNAAVQLVTEAGSLLAGLVGGQIVVEAVFGLHGIGTLLTDAIAARDIPLIQAITLVVAAFIVAINLITDGLVVLLDPRIRKGRGKAHG